MRLPLLFSIILILINLLVDGYLYDILVRRCKSRLPSRIQLWTSAFFLVFIIVAISLPRRSGDNGDLLTVMWMLYAYLTIYLPKYLFVIFDLLARIPNMFHRHRIRILSRIGVLAALAVFVILWWAALINRFNIDVKEVTVEIDGLPETFEGYRIVQISDLHTGTYGNDTSYIANIVERVNIIHPDVIFFTGDIVNARSSELRPHVATLGRLKAADGVYSIMGNHDYGDYSEWPSAMHKQDNLDQLLEMQREMGWKLLLNSTDMLHRGTDSIAIIGVENIGDPPFHIYGSLGKAYPTPADSICKILLSHNPAHWMDSIADHSVNIPLTLAGHTHAMQIEMAGWSPAKWRYPTWGGLYHDTDSTHALYVNIGIGTVGFPARIGATPEITVLTLKKKQSIR